MMAALKADGIMVSNLGFPEAGEEAHAAARSRPMYPSTSSITSLPVS
jgi:hypothetical protein